MPVNPLAAGYMIILSYLNKIISTLNTSFLTFMMKIKHDINQQDFKIVDIHLANLNNFHRREVVNRVSETQLQVGENSN